MKQIFHYTSHNSQNQALVSVNLDSTRVGLLKYVLSHAHEEAGHDLMVIHDLNYIGISEEEVRESAPLPETEALVSFIYWTATRKDPVARLGYSYWAENCYDKISDLTENMKTSLRIPDAKLTFFVSHSVVDVEHFEEVKMTLKRYCINGHLVKEVIATAVATLRLTGHMLDACYDSYAQTHNAVQGAA